jgi:hypothetical protein
MAPYLVTAGEIVVWGAVFGLPLAIWWLIRRRLRR